MNKTIVNKRIEWETLDGNTGFYTYRTRVPGGWLVVICADMIIPTDNYITQQNFTAIPTFIPDQDHIWFVNQHE